MLRVAGVVALGVFGLTACGSDTAGPRPTSDPNILWSVKYDWAAINMALTAPYDTFQLVAVPRTANGSIINDTANAIQYSTTDSAINVTPTGLVTARFVTASARVVAKYTYQGITLADTAIVQVTETPFPAPLATLSIHPQPGGIASSVGNVDNDQETIPFFATIATGNPATDTICNAAGCPTYQLLVRYTTSDPTIAKLDQTGYLNPKRVGHVIFTVSTVAYGVHKVDSLPFVIGYTIGTYPVLYFVDTDSSQTPRKIKVNDIGKNTPLSVGVEIRLFDESQEKVEVTLPGPASGVHFFPKPDYTDHNPDPSRTVDTLDIYTLSFIHADSAGTHTIKFRGLTTGSEVDRTFTTLPYP